MGATTRRAIPRSVNIFTKSALRGLAMVAERGSTSDSSPSICFKHLGRAFLSE